MRQRISAAYCIVGSLLLLCPQAAAQPAPGGPPAVGVVRAERQQITETDEFIGRIQAVNRVALVARSPAFWTSDCSWRGRKSEKGELRICARKAPLSGSVDARKPA